MIPSRIHRLDADALPQLSRGELAERAATWWCWWGRTAPARPIASRRSRFSRPGAACGGRRWTMSPTIRATARGRYRPSVEGALGLATLGTGIDPPISSEGRGEDAATSRRCRIDREPLSSAARVRRSFAHGVADAGDGRAVHGGCVGAGGGFSTAWCWRSTANIPGRVSAAGALLTFAATACWRCAITTTTGATRSSAKPPSLRWAVAAMRGQTVARLAAMLRARGQSLGVSVRRDHARRLDGKRFDQRAGDLRGGPLPRDPAREQAEGLPLPAAPLMVRISPTCR